MAISIEACHAILGIRDKVPTTPEAMAKKVRVTFFPHAKGNVSSETKKFAAELKAALIDLGVEILPYEKVLAHFPLKKWGRWYTLAILNTAQGFIKKALGLKHEEMEQSLKIISKMRKGDRIKKGVSIIALGESDTGNLPIDYSMSFRETMIVTILDMPKHIKPGTNFLTHFDTAMNLFAHHMANIVIAVDKENWLLYNFNAAHPIYSRKENLREPLLKGLIPKLAAPIQPPRLSEFVIREQVFDANDKTHKPFVDDLTIASHLLEGASIYPPGKSIDSLPWRNEFYRWIGRIHLDERIGMSYGFLARQMPVKLPTLIPIKNAEEQFGEVLSKEQDFFFTNGQLHLVLEIKDGRFVIPIPAIWVLTQRSGANKTSFEPNRDLIKMGLLNGKILLETPLGLNFREGYRPSYDTKVILAHAVGNALVGAILKHHDPKNDFAAHLEKNGMALAHWHGYLKKESIKEGWHIHGPENPHVSCSTPQSALFALDGKMKALLASLHNEQEYLRDIHIEPHHGTNITAPTLREFAEFLTQNQGVTELGNKYLHAYLK